MQCAPCAAHLFKRRSGCSTRDEASPATADRSRSCRPQLIVRLRRSYSPLMSPLSGLRTKRRRQVQVASSLVSDGICSISAAGAIQIRQELNLRARPELAPTRPDPAVRCEYRVGPTRYYYRLFRSPHRSSFPKRRLIPRLRPVRLPRLLSDVRAIRRRAEDAGGPCIP